MSALLEAVSLSKTIFSEHNALPAVCNVSISVAPGECVGQAGTSGCGKSTLARLLMRLTPADSG
ncbi:ATP-binding cassette domain-containing protein, partial [Phascolarctobacterium faecium]|uniref:ATP-binding cassette domain-containing protein n=1 Tax=Phascolarctobacterium faecium TaxID=33025 RepID=UPI002731C8B2